MALHSRLASLLIATALASAAAVTPAVADGDWGSGTGGDSQWAGQTGGDGQGAGQTGGDGQWAGQGTGQGTGQGSWQGHQQHNGGDERLSQGVVTANGGLLLRSAPNRSSQVIRVAAQGEIVSIFCRTKGENVQGNRQWYLLTDGTWAWGSARYIDPIGSPPRWC